MGPFELMDLIGNDINYTVTETVWKQLFYDPRFKPSQSQKSLFEAGFYGRKTGKGWYDYALELPTPKKDTALANEIFLRVISMLVNETADSLYLKLASKEDLDIAMIKGVNYPKGLLTWGEEIGIEVILSKLESLYQDYCEDRYRPSILLKKLSEKKSKTFHV